MKVLRWLLAVLLIAGTAVGFVRYWQFRTLHPSTDDAYVQAHIVRVSSRVTAPAKTIHVVDNQFVRAGEPLFDQGPRMFEARLAEARAKLDVAALDTGAGGAEVRAASAALRERQVTADNARRTLTRLQALARQRLAPEQALDDALAAYNEARAQVASAVAELERAREALGDSGPRNARLRRAAAEVQQAELNLSFTHVTATADGWVTEHSLRKGTMVHAGQTMFALVEAGEWWVEANFRETDLTRIRVGQPVRIELDMYPDMVLKGRVTSVSAGSGATFSLLPPENATGNWVKVTQRFPVRIALDALPGDPGTPLRVGSSATVEVDTTALDAAATTAGP
ncbi:MAG: HlyD family secretion protein [Gammaproteobacteria bacterium]